MSASSEMHSAAACSVGRVQVSLASHSWTRAWSMGKTQARHGGKVGWGTCALLLLEAMVAESTRGRKQLAFRCRSGKNLDAVDVGDGKEVEPEDRRFARGNVKKKVGEVRKKRVSGDGRPPKQPSECAAGGRRSLKYRLVWTDVLQVPHTVVGLLITASMDPEEQRISALCSPSLSRVVETLATNQISTDKFCRVPEGPRPTQGSQFGLLDT